MLQHIVFDLGVGCPILKFGHIFQRELNPNLFRVDLALGKQDYRLHVARYLLIDVRSCARLRKHILSKRKPVHSSDIAHSQLRTDAICSKIDILIKVLTIEVYGNKPA